MLTRDYETDINSYNIYKLKKISKWKNVSIQNWIQNGFLQQQHNITERLFFIISPIQAAHKIIGNYELLKNSNFNFLAWHNISLNI